MSEKDVIVTSWIYDEEVLAAFIHAIDGPYPNARIYGGRVVCVSEAVPTVGALMEVEKILNDLCESEVLHPGHGQFKVVVIPENGDAVTYTVHRRHWTGSAGCVADEGGRDLDITAHPSGITIVAKDEDAS